MEASWLQAFFTFFFLFLATNVFFACVYLTDPGGITGARATFGDAFFFSVQTLTTIGFGTMSPHSMFTNLVVTIESAVGLLGVAISTGVFFAKASKPSSKVIFSSPAVILNENDIPTLMFRVGNMRGNEIVEAEMSLTALIETRRETTTMGGSGSGGGKSFRKLHDLKLVRKRSPIFTLSWTVMHQIDADSPLYGMTDENIELRLVGIVCAMMGYDSTYGQQVHSRHHYYPEHIYFDRDFEDIISVDKGKLSVNYRKFHETHELY